MLVEMSTEALREQRSQFSEPACVEHPHEFGVGLVGAHVGGMAGGRGCQTRWLMPRSEKRTTQLDKSCRRILQRAQDPILVVRFERQDPGLVREARLSLEAVGISTLHINHSTISRATGTPAGVSGNCLRLLFTGSSIGRIVPRGAPLRSSLHVTR
jgi:hypothetical protein